MKRLFAIVFLCGFLIPSAYGETINFDNGDTYVGGVSNGIPHGNGTYIWSDGRKYVGRFKDGTNMVRGPRPIPMEQGMSGNLRMVIEMVRLH